MAEYSEMCRALTVEQNKHLKQKEEHMQFAKWKVGGGDENCRYNARLI